MANICRAQYQKEETFKERLRERERERLGGKGEKEKEREKEGILPLSGDQLAVN